MGNKEKCKEAMSSFFGPASANMVDAMDESNCISKCREKIVKLLGEDKAKQFDGMVK